MIYQLPPLIDEDDFERLVRDIMRRVFDDPGIERFGRGGQSQWGIDGRSPANSKITFQCKLKDTRYQTDAGIRAVLMKEMEEELGKTTGLGQPITRFVFASTFKNDTHLQEQAASLSSDSLTVEYWGWDTITERIWEFAEALIPVYYPQIPVRPVHGLRQITRRQIETSRITDRDQLNKLALDYYRINDRGDVVFQVVCNDIDVRNERVMETVYRRLEALTPSGTLWLVGDGGSGKTTILHRIALELAERGQSVFMLNLEAHLGHADVDSTLSLIKFCSTSEQPVLCIDNPAADELALERILSEIPDYSANVRIILSERAHRYRALLRTGVLTYLHGEEENEPVNVRNPRNQRERVYDKLFDLLGVSEVDREPLREIVRNENLVYVNATYSILLELKKQEKIVFDFDWDDYRKIASGISAFSEGYKYIALFYLFGARTPFGTFSRICGADEAQQKLFLEKFRGLVNEPIIVDEWRDQSFQKVVHLRTKHEIVSEIFFREHPEINTTELLMEWCEQTDFGEPLEAQALINIFGAKKNYLAETSQVKFEKIIEFLLNGHLREKVAGSAKLLGAISLARFWLLVRSGNSDKAIAVLESFVKSAPEDLHSRTELAKAYQKENRLSEAEAVLMELLRLEPDDLQARTEMGRIYQRQGRFDEAEAVLLNLLEIDPKNLQARTELAKTYQRVGELVKAESVLLGLLEIEKHNIRGFTELAKVYQKQNRLNESEAVLLKILEKRKNDLNAQTELAKVYQRQNRLVDAEPLLQNVLRTNPNDLNSRTELAKIYQRQGKLAEAATTAEEVLVLDPLNDFAMSELLGVWTRQGKKEKCKERFLAFIGQPRYQFTRYSQAPVFRFFRCCQKFGMKDEAKLVFDRFQSQLDDRNVDLYKSTLEK